MDNGKPCIFIRIDRTDKKPLEHENVFLFCGLLSLQYVKLLLLNKSVDFECNKESAILHYI